MARLLIGGDWYEAIASTAYYEEEYERLILEQAEQLYPRYRMVSFKTTVASGAGIAKPDFALLSADYVTWWVVEVELAHHSLGGHVMPQVEVLAQAKYSEAEARYLAARDPSLKPAKLRELMRGAQPRVLVIVNAPRPEWQTPLSRFGAILAVVEIYRSGQNRHVLRVNGDSPETPGLVLSKCRLDPFIPRLLRVDSPAAIEPGPDGKVYLDYQGSLTVWERVATKDAVWLNPIQTNPLPAHQAFVVIRGGDGRLLLRPEAAIPRVGP